MTQHFETDQLPISQGRAQGLDGNKRSHPAIRDLLQARALAARKLRMLGLDLEAARLACSVPEPTSVSGPVAAATRVVTR